MPQPLQPPALDELAEQLALLEERAEAGKPAAADATVAGVKAELDTIVADLRGRPSPSDYDQESACRKVIEMVQAIGRDPEPERTIDPSEIKGRVATAEPAALGTLGVYELLAKLGEGGMGAVYKARHTKLDKIVAIKVLPSSRVQDEEAVARFEREMRAVGKLEHPNIVRAMDAGEAGGRHFLVMEYVPGIDLSQLVKQLGPLPIADACELIRQAAVGLEEARENGMVHRDIKPSNLMLCVVGKKKPPVVKVLDMGLALLSEAYSPEAKGLTTTGQMMGTLDYMAPEQGGDSHEVDIRADIYSLGASLYKLLCGEVIYFGPQFQTPVQKMMALATQAAPPIASRRPEVPGELAAVLHRMLAKAPAQRYGTPEEVAQALAPFCGGANLAALLNKVGFDVTPSKDGSLSVSAESRSQPDIDTDRVGNSPTLAPAVRTKVPPAAPRAASPSVAPSPMPMPVIQVQPKPQPAKPQEAGASKSPPWLPLAIGGGLFGVGGLAAIIALTVFYFDTPRGTLRVEINDPTIEVTVKGSDVVLKKAEKEEITLTPGPHALVVKRGDFIFTTRDFELKKGDVTTVRVQVLPGKVQVAAANGRVIDSKPFGKPGPDLPVPGQGTPAGPALPTAPLASAFPASGLDLPAGKFALSFDHGDKVVVAKVPFRETTMVTIEAWVSVDLTDDDRVQTIVKTPNGEIGMKQKALRFYTHHGHIDIPDVVPSQRRVHVAGVNDGRVRRVYLNGKLVGKTDDPGSVPPAVLDFELRIGWDVFRGVIDAVRVSTTARYDKEFTPPTELKTDKETFALYQFNEGQGDVLNDSSGNGYHAKIQGAKWVKGTSSSADQAAVARWLLENKKLGNIGFEVDGNLESLKALPPGPVKVRELSFHPVNNAGALKEEDIPRLAVFTDLESLILSRQPLTDAGLASLAPLKKLKRLEILATGVTAASAATIREFPQLEHLQGPGDDLWLKALTGARLRSLQFYRETMSADAVGWFKDYPLLTELAFIECGTWPNEKLALLQECKNLSKLEVSYTPIDDSSIEIFSKLSTLTELKLIDTKLTEAGLKKIAAALPKCKITWTGGVIPPAAK